MWGVRERGVRDDFRVFGLSNRKMNLPFTEIGKHVGRVGLKDENLSSRWLTMGAGDLIWGAVGI